MDDKETKRAIKNELKHAKSENKDQTIPEKVTERTGYEPKELLKAPIEPPKEVKDPRPASSNQKSSIITGVVFIVFGLIFWGAISFWAFVVLAIIGITLIAYGGLVRS